MPVTTDVIAGGPDDFMTVRHLSLSGSQHEIGKALAHEATERSGWRPRPADPVKSRARHAWFARNWPAQYARNSGAAEVAGVQPDAAVHFDDLSTIPPGSGCSAVWYSPAATSEGHGFLGRNYDFFTVGWQQMLALMSDEPGPTTECPIASRPYVITSVPDDGPATTIITMNELDGCMDGINEHGLAVVLLIADAGGANLPVDGGPQVGLATTQLPRFLLDTCANVEEAQQALLLAKQYDLGAPLHYLIADRAGNAFVWEVGAGGVEHIVPAEGLAQCVTNHPLHRPTDPAKPPVDTEETMYSYARLDTLRARAESAPLSANELRTSLDSVALTSEPTAKYPLRTLWRTVFNLDERTMTTRFYLGDDSRSVPAYSPEFTFRPELTSTS
ncbi:putative choloylglycine hydrolase [Tamaricihabitans halophyticus]|uniref:Putative choloylglycine hydrolase n=1 Tax=Tamaricihabitans halophyticus TaxID=1262583 RepID=A0A4R2QW79_9PSEU|nr:C45 family peptidase [Tamaricihabitans halophyticus]TCP53514.1 putative choloylglycine hydrolase [Tamaricihabitans halophyticus]